MALKRLWYVAGTPYCLIVLDHMLPAYAGGSADLHEQPQLHVADLSATIAVAALLAVVPLVALYQNLRIALAAFVTTVLSSNVS